MEELLNFFIEIGKLKRMPRRGWVINQIKNPESIASHIFRAAIITWILGEKKEIDEEKILKMVLIHDLPKVYAKDITPYDPILPQSKEKLVRLMRTWPKFSEVEKKKSELERYKKEWQALIRLTSKLPSELRREIRELWLDYKKGLTKERRFVSQADRLDNLLQALEYWKKYKKPPLIPWWCWAREFFVDPLLVEFVDTLDKNFLRKEKWNNFFQERSLTQTENLINFFVEIGKLKRMPRRGWALRGLKNPETIAEHSFRVALLAWFLGQKEKFNSKEIIKMALVHDLCEVYAGDITPYDKFLIYSESKKEKKELFEKWPRFLKLEKVEQFLNKHRKEWCALINLTSKLEPEIRQEIINLWLNYDECLTKEGRFVRQVDKIENLLQALEYWKENKKFPIGPWWIQIEELVDNPILLEFLKILEKKFHQK
jgi:putative hydrolase of HD superfamily